MSLKQCMHPRNPFKKHKPDFKQLAIKYQEFRNNVTQSLDGLVHLDFKDPKALRALSCALLKDNFDLDVDIPLDRLIPTVPLRLNYILWLEDIIGKGGNIHGIDIGCGASCIYPLLGTKLNEWKFLACDIDEQNLDYSQRNVKNNNLEDKIEVIRSEKGSMLVELLKDTNIKYDFCMCNPPFFGTNLEAYSVASRKDDRQEPSSSSTASEAESVTSGGEFEFVKRMIKDSLILKDRIRVYSTMLGKKCSLGKLKGELASAKIRNIGSYEFCQGKTLRWGLAWSFDDTVKFPVSPFQAKKKEKKTIKPSKITLPKAIDDKEVTAELVAPKIELLLKELDINVSIVMKNKFIWSANLSAKSNTWSNQRRKRRQKAREMAAKKLKDEKEGVTDNMDVSSAESELGDETKTELKVQSSGIDQNKSNTQSTDRLKCEPEVYNTSILINGSLYGEPSTSTENNSNESSVACTSCDKNASDNVDGNAVAKDTKESNIVTKENGKFLVKLLLSVRKEKGRAIMEGRWLEGNRDHVYEILQFFQNNLK